MLQAFGMRTTCSRGLRGIPLVSELAGVAVVVCGIMRPAEDLPIEASIAAMYPAMYRFPVRALIPGRVALTGATPEPIADVHRAAALSGRAARGRPCRRSRR